MDRKAGPSLKLNLPELVECSECKGIGKVKPMFHEMTCSVCGGSGVLSKETGERIPDDQIIPALKATVRHLRNQLHLAREELSKASEHNPYPEQMPVRSGGTHRMD